MQKIGWKFIELKNYDELKINFRNQICRFNADKLIAAKGVAELSDAEFRRLLLQIENFDVITAAEHWKNNNAVMLDLDNEKYMYLQLSSPDAKKNVYQISHQIRMEKSASPVVKNNNRYDVTLLINGLPILQTELKRPGVDFTEAVNQVNRYRRDSFGGLFNFLQLFVVSNETATKYFSNQNRNQNGQFNKIQASMVFFWLTKTNERVVRLSEFADAVLTPERLTDILYNYMIIKKEEKQLIVMRPYQIYEVEAAVKRVVEENSNGFITACTGSGKTLTSFKTAQVLRDILIVVDMFLTGFDAKPLNTLYLDKNLQWHGLIQAYSRTNRVYKKTKTCGNIVTYRNLKKRQDEALALFSGNGDPNACIRGNYEDYLRDWTKYVNTLRSIAKTPYDAAKIVSESVKKAFVEAFRDVMRTLKQMELFTIFKWSDLAKDLTCDEYEAYEGVYKNIRNSAKGTDEPEGSGLADIDFETELIGTDTVNFDYIMGLLTVIRSVQPVSKRMEMLDKLLTDYEDGDDEVLRIQKELLKKFVTERLNDLPEGLDEDEMRSAFYAYKKGLEKEEVKGFAFDVGVEERVIEGILAECVRSGEALMSACCGIKDYVKGGFGKKRSAVKSMVMLAQKYAV